MKRFPLRLTQSNPFYLLSAACMLGGCLTINNSLHWIRIPMPRDILLLATLNLYEMALIALAWHLVRCRRLIHDGVMLLALEAFFLVDVAFVNAEVVTSNFALGLLLDVVLFLAAIVKLLYMVKIAGLSVRDGRFAAMMIQLAALFAVPSLFRYFDGGDLPTFFFYGAWWAVGLLIPACLKISRLRTQAQTPSLNGIVRLLCILPWMSFLLHLGNLHWVYNVTFYAAEVAPVLLGLACLIHHLKPSRIFSQRDLLTLQFLLPIIAIFVSLTNPTPLCFAMGKQGRYYFTPIDLGVAGAYLTYIYCFARPYAIQFLAAGAAAVLAFVFGPSTQQLADSISKTWISNAAWSIIPKTAINAGISAIAAAFAFLGLGAVVSLRRQPPDPCSDPPNIPES